MHLDHSRAFFVAFTLLIWAGPVFAQDAVRMEVVRKGQQGQSDPALVVLPQVQSQLNVHVLCGSVVQDWQGSTGPGQRIELPLVVAVGTYRCKGAIGVVLENGDEGEMPLSFEIQQYAPLRVTVPRSGLDVAGRRLEATLDRAVGRIEAEIYGSGEKLLGVGQVDGGGRSSGAGLPLTWDQSEGEVFHIRVKGVDADGFWAAVDLFPWSYNIPHVDVNFESAKWDIQRSEEPKLQSVVEDANAALARYPDLNIPMNLYVGGYTDTVGDGAYNQGLSQSRAEAIARWFKANGFARPIYYQGFGEDALAVSTGDGVDEIRNRRSMYVLSAEQPYSADFPRGNWKKLD